jgi:hypothetical protein
MLQLVRVGKSAVENELRAITKLCKGGHKNIINVIGISNSLDSPYAFIDMELCDLNLEEYIKCNWTMIETAHQMAARELEIWNIAMQIVDGLAFIHSHREVHRDLKPRNGCFPLFEIYANETSTLLSNRWSLEIIRFWTDLRRHVARCPHNRIWAWDPRVSFPGTSHGGKACI